MPTSGITTRKRPVQRMNSAHRQLEIVNAAFDSIATTGHLSLSTTELAHKVGISQPAIFRHFRSKQQLHKAILDEANRRVVDELKILIGNSEKWNDPVDLLKEVVVSMGNSFERSPGVWLTLICQRSIVAEADIPEEVLAPISHKCAITQFAFALERLSKTAVENGQLERTTNPKDVSNVFLSLLFGMGQLWLNNARDFDLSMRLNLAVIGVLGGFYPRAHSNEMPVSAIA